MYTIGEYDYKVCSLYYFYSCKFSVCLKLFINKKLEFLKMEPKVVVLKVLMADFTIVVQHK